MILRERVVEKILEAGAEEAKQQPSHHPLAGREPTYLQGDARPSPLVPISQRLSGLEGRALQIFAGRMRKPIHRY